MGDSRSMSGGTMGLPLKMGWEAPRLFEKESHIAYKIHSRGNFCNNGGVAPFLAEGDFDEVDCLQRCTRAHNCASATIYGNGWCQLGSKCAVEGIAGDESST